MSATDKEQRPPSDHKKIAEDLRQHAAQLRKEAQRDKQAKLAENVVVLRGLSALQSILNR